MKRHPCLAIDPLEFEQLVLGLSPVALGAFVRLAVWSFRFGPLPLDAARRARLAQLDTPSEQRALRELRHLFERRRGGLVSPWVEQQRRENSRLSKKRAATGRLGGLARAVRPASAPATAERGPRLQQRERARRPAATYKLLAAFAGSLFDQYDALDPAQPARPTIFDMKEKAGKYFDWSEEPDLPGRAFDAAEHLWQQRHERTRKKYERAERAQQRRAQNPTLQRHRREIERMNEWQSRRAPE